MILFVYTHSMCLSNLYRIFISVDLDGLYGFSISILISIIMFLRFISKMNNLQQEMNMAISVKKLSEKSSALSTIRIRSINCDSIKVFNNKIIILEYTWYATRLCSDDQESGRQHPNIVKSLKVYLRICISKAYLLWSHLRSTQYM